jgi:hypothetical protein
VEPQCLLPQKHSNQWEGRVLLESTMLEVYLCVYLCGVTYWGPLLGSVMSFPTALRDAMEPLGGTQKKEGLVPRDCCERPSSPTFSAAHYFQHALSRSLARSLALSLSLLCSSLYFTCMHPSPALNGCPHTPPPLIELGLLPPL